MIRRCRQDRIPYDPAKHRALQTLPTQQQPTAAA
jgi:hypothetical protein